VRFREKTECPGKMPHHLLEWRFALLFPPPPIGRIPGRNRLYRAHSGGAKHRVYAFGRGPGGDPFRSFWDTTCPRGRAVTGHSLALKEGCYGPSLPIMGSYGTPLALKEGCYGTPLPINGILWNTPLAPEWAYSIPWGIWAYWAHSMIHKWFSLWPFLPHSSPPLHTT